MTGSPFSVCQDDNENLYFSRSTDQGVWVHGPPAEIIIFLPYHNPLDSQALFGILFAFACIFLDIKGKSFIL